ncbi:MAG: hypothetical protein ACP5RO_06765, partial [Fervidicoccaceae archaeon]
NGVSIPYCSNITYSEILKYMRSYEAIHAFSSPCACDMDSTLDLSVRQTCIKNPLRAGRRSATIVAEFQVFILKF